MKNSDPQFDFWEHTHPEELNPKKQHVPHEEIKKEKSSVIFCHSCKTDLRPQNLKFHLDHKIEKFDRDPRK